MLQFLTYKMFRLVIILSIIIESKAQFEEIEYEIFKNETISNMSEKFSWISVSQCAAKCMTRSRQGACAVAGYDFDSKTCQLAVDNTTVPTHGDNYIVLRPGKKNIDDQALSTCNKTIESDNAHVVVDYSNGIKIGSEATVTCEIDYKSDSGLKSWIFECVADGGNTWKPLKNPPDCVWELLFRGTAENGYNVTNAYLFGDESDGVTTSQACKDVYNTECMLNYRSLKVDSWTTLDILQVSYELYNETDVVMTVVFNGIGSTIHSWFSTANVESVPWTIPAGQLYWSAINGLVDIGNGRSFRMTTGYGLDCADHYYTLVKYIPEGPCSYENFTVYPTFTYSADPQGSMYDTQPFQTARAMGIWVKYV